MASVGGTTNIGMMPNAHASMEAGSRRMLFNTGVNFSKPARLACSTAVSNDNTAPQLGQVLTSASTSPEQEGHKLVR